MHAAILSKTSFKSALLLQPNPPTPRTLSGFGKIKARLLEIVLVIEAGLFWTVVLLVAGLSWLGIGILGRVNTLKRPDRRIGFSRPAHAST